MSSVAAMWAPLLFGFALFLSSALLFLMQPMTARTLLPHVGGNPIAWNACLVFFQATLLAGYVYADLLHRLRGLRWQPWFQLLLLATATVLCFAGVLGDGPLVDYAPRLAGLDTAPIVNTFSLLALTIGLPFLALAAIGPLLQRWFAHLDHPKASDPYFLFVASNLGGLTALVFYPIAIEPNVPTYGQWMSWKLAVVALGVLLFLVALVAWLSPRNPELEPAAPTDANAPLVPTLIGRGPATWPRRLYWLIASALPAGLLMSVTDYLTLDVAPTPLLWTLPLALYLLAFSQAFGRFAPLEWGGTGYKVILHVSFGVVLVSSFLVAFIIAWADNPGRQHDGPVPVFLGFAFVSLLMTPRSWLFVLQPISVLVVVLLQTNVFTLRGLNVGLVMVYLTCFYFSARLCLEMLAADRPAAPAVTTYCNWIAIGGLLGGLFQIVIAPVLFPREYLEFPLLAALATALRPTLFTNGLTDWIAWKLLRGKKGQNDQPDSGRKRLGLTFDLGLAALLALVTAGLFLLLRWDLEQPAIGGVRILQLLYDYPLVLVLVAAALLVLRPLRFGLALAAIVLLSQINSQHSDDGSLLLRQRTPFGVVRVMVKAQEGSNPDRFGLKKRAERILMHGTTNHGTCFVEPPELRRYPTTYYHQQGPIGRVMSATAWFTPPRGGPGNPPNVPWLERHKEYVNNDARIVASLIGLGATPIGTATLPVDQLTAGWSEPPYAIVGVGTGTLYAYAHPYQWVDGYELDPLIADLSQQEAPVFHHLALAKARGVQGGGIVMEPGKPRDDRIIVGDGRRKLAKAQRDGFYHMIFLDTFNSDAIPVHMLTEEALVGYFQKLHPEGILCVHTSNRYLDLTKVLERTAQKLNLSTRHVHGDPGPNDVPSQFATDWVMLARNRELLDWWLDRGAAGANAPPQFPNFPFQRQFGSQLWTDEHASPMSALRPGLGWPTLIYTILVCVFLYGMILGVLEVIMAMMNQSKKPAAAPKK